MVVVRCRLFQTPTLLRGCPSSVQNVQSNIMWMIYTYTMYLWLWQRRDSSICTIFPGPPRMLWFWRSFNCAYIFLWATWLHTNCRHLSDLHFLSSAGYWLLGSPLLKGHPQLGKKSSFLLPYFCIEGISSSSYQWRILAFLPSIYHIWYHIITHCTQFWLCESNLWFLMKVIMPSVPLKMTDPN